MLPPTPRRHSQPEPARILRGASGESEPGVAHGRSDGRAALSGADRALARRRAPKPVDPCPSDTRTPSPQGLTRLSVPMMILLANSVGTGRSPLTPPPRSDRLPFGDPR